MGPIPSAFGRAIPRMFVGELPVLPADLHFGGYTSLCHVADTILNRCTKAMDMYDVMYFHTLQNSILIYTYYR